MQTTRYLYDMEATDLASMNYKEALLFKVSQGNELLQKLVHKDNMTDYIRMSKVMDAIKFNERLLDELRVGEEC